MVTGVQRMPTDAVKGRHARQIGEGSDPSKGGKTPRKGSGQTPGDRPGWAGARRKSR